MTSDINGLQNRYGGERAICPKCKKPNSESYKFLEGDWRNLKCSECGKSSPFALYFTNEIEKLKNQHLGD